MTGTLKEKVPHEAVVENEGKQRGKRHPNRASGETGPAVHEAS